MTDLKQFNYVLARSSVENVFTPGKIYKKLCDHTENNWIRVESDMGPWWVDSTCFSEGLVGLVTLND